METTQIFWGWAGPNDTLLLPGIVKERAYTQQGGCERWVIRPNIRDVSMNCAKLANQHDVKADNQFGNTAYSLRSYLIKQGFITPAK